MTLVLEHACPRDEHLVHTGRRRRGTGSAARDVRDTALRPLPPLDDVPVVGGQHHRASGSQSALQERAQVLDSVGGPDRPGWVAAVEGVVDGVEDAGDELLVTVRDLQCDIVGHGEAWLGGVQRLLVEDLRAPQPQRRDERGVPGLLAVLPTDGQLAAQQRRSADLGERGQHGQAGRAHVRLGEERLLPAFTPREDVVDNLGGHARAHPVQDEQQRPRCLGDGDDDTTQQVLQQPHTVGATGRRQIALDAAGVVPD